MRISPDLSKKAASWDSYWLESNRTTAYCSDGDTHPVIAEFWRQFFEMSMPLFDLPHVLDIASGKAALLSYALAAPGGDSAQFTCIDISEQAVAGIRARHPNVRAVVADAANVELPSGAFHIVTSQFGVEYAGPNAISEAVRLLVPNGRLALLMHHADSPIHRDCIAGLDAVDKVRSARFIPLALEFFSAGFDAVRGGDRAPYEQAAKRLSPAVRSLEEAVAHFGTDVAGGVVANLYNDVKKMHQNIQGYEPSEVLGWLQKMHEELDDYVERMSEMISVALDKESFSEVCGVVKAAGGEVLQSGPLFAPGNIRPLAWTLLVSK